jgi:hypothetical protein
MTIEGAIADRLRDIAPLTALVSNRIYQFKLPQGSDFPAVRVQLISAQDEVHLRGPVALERSRIQVDAFAQEETGLWYATCAAVADAIHGDGLGPNASGLHGWFGEIGGSPAEFRVVLIERVDRRPDYEAGELKIARIRQDYRVHWQRIM